MIEQILESYPEENFTTADGFDSAIIGVEENSMRVIYSVSKILNILEEEMSSEEALEYYYYNIEGAYVGEKTPIYCNDIF